MRRKILHVVGGMDRGGVETWLMHVMREILTGTVSKRTLWSTAMRSQRTTGKSPRSEARYTTAPIPEIPCGMPRNSNGWFDSREGSTSSTAMSIGSVGL